MFKTFKASLVAAASLTFLTYGVEVESEIDLSKRGFRRRTRPSRAAIQQKRIEEAVNTPLPQRRVRLPYWKRVDFTNPNADCDFVTAQVGRRYEMPGFHVGHYTPQRTDELLGEEYQAQSAYCKEEQIWRLVVQDRERQPYFHDEEFNTSFASDFKVTFQFPADSMPFDRFKKTHPVGVVLKVRMVITDHSSDYTGFLKTGAEHAIMRISEFVDTDPKAPQKSARNTVPGFGVKLLVDGCESANGFFMNNFDAVNSFNFFKEPYMNHLPLMANQCVLHTLGRKMAESSTRSIGTMSILDWAKRDQKCNKWSDEEVHWPYMLRVQGQNVLGWDDEYEKEFYDQFQDLPPYVKLFDIQALDCPEEHGCKFKRIGFFETTSFATPSDYGDKRLFFRHENVDEEVKIRPHFGEWHKEQNNVFPADIPQLGETDNKLLVTGTDDEAGCPFAYLFRSFREELGLTDEDSMQKGEQALKAAGVLNAQGEPIITNPAADGVLREEL